MKPGASHEIAGPSPIALVEEAVHLLRRAEPLSLAIYYAGAAPFALGLAFFWARTTWFQPDRVELAWTSLGVVGLFALMKTAQAEFCARLLAQRLGTPAPAWSWSRLRRTLTVQWRIQAWGCLVLPLALVVAVPFGWAYAFFQSAGVLGENEKAAGIAREQAVLWPGQNHLGLLFLGLFGLAVWANVAVAFWMVPWLANRLLGLENIFGFSGVWMLNTTFLMATVMLAWLAMDPVVKAFFTLRVFYGRSRRDGEDLRVELAVARRGQPGRRAALVLALLVAGTGWPTVRVQAAPVEAGAGASGQRGVSAQELDTAIEEVLAGGDYTWRLRPLPRAEDATAARGPFARFLQQAVDWVRDFFQWLGRIWRAVTDWFDRQFPTSSRVGPAASTGLGALAVLMWIFIVLVAGLTIAVVVLAWWRARGFDRKTLAARPVTLAAPDLEDENTQAAQLPADGWMALAREQLAKGEGRLALRALQLATLARFAAEGLVSLAKFKTNLDYEREVRRRALSRGALVPWFTARRGAFEAVWYGRAPAEETLVRAWLADLERPSLE